MCPGSQRGFVSAAQVTHKHCELPCSGSRWCLVVGSAPSPQVHRVSLYRSAALVADPRLADRPPAGLIRIRQGDDGTVEAFAGQFGQDRRTARRAAPPALAVCTCHLRGNAS